MKHLTLTAALVAGLAAAAQAQSQTPDQVHKFEVGLDVLNYSPFVSGYSSFTNTRNNDKAHWLSGAMFRYNVGRFGLRAGANYTTSTQKVEENYCNDCLTGGSKGKELRLRVGGQYTPFASAPWLYVFTDVYYRRYTSEGNFSGGFTGFQNVAVGVKSNGVGFNAGFGAKVRLLNHFYLNPEVYYDAMRARNTATNTDLGDGTSYQMRSRTYVHAPAARLNLIYAF